MPDNLLLMKQMLYDKCGFNFSQLVLEKESAAYEACTFYLNDKVVLFRSAKITPTKSGQFVTLWKRNGVEPIQPFAETDKIDLVVIVVRNEKHFGHFVFPKNILIEKGVLSTQNKEGKRAMRVYPPWDIATNKQASKTQQWQLLWFIDLSENKSLDLLHAKGLYQS